MRVRMPFPLRLLLVVVSFGGTAGLAQDLSQVPKAERSAAARIFKTYRHASNPAAREQAAETLTRMHPPVLLAFVPMLEKDFALALADYRAAVQRAASDVARKRARSRSFSREVTALRGTFAKLRAAGVALTKERLQLEGEPALRRLRELHVITMADVVAEKSSLGRDAERVRSLAHIRGMVKKLTRLQDEREFTERDLWREESAILAGAVRHDSRMEKVLHANAAMRASGAVPEDEAEGVRELNGLRMLLGLAPLRVDPALHNAARGHSQDMAVLGFFGHESPAPGRTTPWDRARLAGTTASAENISVGTRDPRAVVTGLFFSPAHHGNIVGGYRRVGMGRFDRHWTQMFGR